MAVSSRRKLAKENELPLGADKIVQFRLMLLQIEQWGIRDEAEDILGYKEIKARALAALRSTDDPFGWLSVRHRMLPTLTLFSVWLWKDEEFKRELDRLQELVGAEPTARSIWNTILKAFAWPKLDKRQEKRFSNSDSVAIHNGVKGICKTFKKYLIDKKRLIERSPNEAFQLAAENFLSRKGKDSDSFRAVQIVGRSHRKIKESYPNLKALPWGTMQRYLPDLPDIGTVFARYWSEAGYLP